MSTQLAEVNGVTVNKFVRGHGLGVGYQVTWGVDKYAQFDDLHYAMSFMFYLGKAYKK